MPLRTARAMRFDRVSDSGRNRPLRFVVLTDDGAEHEVFLKCSARPTLGAEGLANELLAACLAADLGLPISECFLVEVPPELTAIIPDQEIRDVLQRSAPVFFASKSVGDQARLWSPQDRLRTDQLQAGLQIFAFDVFIANDDRGPEFVNLLVRGDSIHIIDHELAFRLRLKLFPPQEPWRQGFADRLATPGGHVLATSLRGATDLDFEALAASWRGLTDEQLEGYLASIPAEWSEAFDEVRLAIEYLKRLRDRIDDCVAELKRSLQ